MKKLDDILKDIDNVACVIHVNRYPEPAIRIKFVDNTTISFLYNTQNKTLRYYIEKDGEYIDLGHIGVCDYEIFDNIFMILAEAIFEKYGMYLIVDKENKTILYNPKYVKPK